MKRAGVLLSILTLLGAVGCGNSVTAPSNPPIVLTAQLSPADEVPPVGNSESSGRGAVQITFVVTRNATGDIDSASGTFYFQLSGFPSGISLIGGHIHRGAAGTNGPVVVNAGVTSTSVSTSENGAITFTATGIVASAATLQAIIDNPAGYYFNVHSTTNPGGVARGQLRRTL